GSADHDHGDWADAKLACGAGGNQPPVAQASANPTSGTVPLTVAFSSAGSSDPDGSISAYSWDLNGDGTYGDSTAANPSSQYATAGTYTVRLRVTDNQGAQATSSPLTITATGGGGGGSTTYVSDLTPTGTPVNGWGPWEKDRSNGEQAAGDGHVLTLNGTTYQKGLGVHADSDLRFALPANCTTFTAQVGIDDEVGSNGSVIFQVIADGTRLYTSAALTGASATVPVSVSVAGRAQLQLVVDANGSADHDHGDWADAKLACGAGGNQPPVAQASANPTSGTVPLTVAFSSAGSSDPDGSISAYSWDLNGDGTYGDSTAANPSSQYATAGTYTVRLRVTDNQGAQATSSPVTITATSAGNQPPVAQASANPTSGTVPLTVAFSSAGSSDPDGSISAYSWDLNGDGTYGDSTAANPSSQYATAGTYTVRLRVTDNQGAQATSSPVTITAT